MEFVEELVKAKPLSKVFGKGFRRTFYAGISGKVSGLQRLRWFGCREDGHSPRGFVLLGSSMEVSMSQVVRREEWN